MDPVLLEQIYRTLNLRETEDLIAIHQEKNLDEWTEDTFKIIEKILLERLGTLPPEKPEFQMAQGFDRAEAALQSGDLAMALSECDALLQKAPELAIAYNLRGEIYDELDQPTKAIHDYQTALRLDPELDAAWENLKSVEVDMKQQFEVSGTKRHLDDALEFIYAEEPGLAMQEIEAARLTLPKVAFSYNYLGMILEEAGQIEQAVEAYLEATRLNPRFLAARTNLGNARVKFEAEQYRQAGLVNWQFTPDEEQAWLAVEKEFLLDIAEYDEWELPGEFGEPLPGWVYLDEQAHVLPGWPGHRTRPGRSGYDPLDLDFEEAHTEGVMIRKLLTGRLRTHNPVYFLGMLYTGVLFCLPIPFAGMALLQAGWFALTILIVISPYWLVGLMILFNVLASLVTKVPQAVKENGGAFY